MTMSGTLPPDDRGSDDLETAFTALRAADAGRAPRAAFVETLMADALAAQPRVQPQVRVPASGSRRAWLRWPGWQGLLACAGSAIAGVAMGYLAPVSIEADARLGVSVLVAADQGTGAFTAADDALAVFLDPEAER
ncbi:MAG: hypothetical protein AAGE76_03820 [Pseudomonadota bacterium]